jgi:hypothetical protein
MANEEHLAQLREGVDAWNAWRKEHPNIVPDLSEASLVGADLSLANLSGANLRGAYLREAKLSWGTGLLAAVRLGGGLSRANPSRANLCSGADLWKDYSADLSGADFSGANLFRANLSGADLSHAVCRDVDFRQATLIDTCFDGADLTGAKLWQMQRGGWSIRGVTCQYAFRDRDGKEPTEYGDGDFERIFAEKPRIVLRYPGGLSPVELAMLPLIVERLQTEHPDCVLHIRSVQDDGNGATVTITIDDRAGRSAEAFAQDIEVLRQDFAAIQQRLQHEERLRLEIECRYRAVVEDVLPKVLERALPKTEVNVGQITGPTIIEGTAMSRDTYNISGQAGAVGPNSHAHDMAFQQIQNSLDLPKLAEELGRLRSAMKQESEGTREQDKAVAAVAEAEEAAIKGDGRASLRHLNTAGKWALGIAEKIGVPVAVDAIKKALGLLAGI